VVVILVAASASCRIHAASEDADFRRAQHLYTLHEYKMATEEFAKYLSSFPKSERSEQARLLLAESEYQLKDYAKAGADLDTFLADFPASTRRADGLQRAVKVHWYLKEYPRSIECAELFLKENRDRLGKSDTPPALHALFEQVLYYAGDASYGLKKYDQAKTYWDRLKKEFPKSALIPDASEGLGWVAFDNKVYDEAVANFTITAQTPEHPKAAASQLMIARGLDLLGKSAEALTALDKVAGLTGGKDAARDVALWRAPILLHAKRLPEALAAYKLLAQSFADHPDTPTAVLQGISQLEDQGQNAEAGDLAEIYLASFPKGADRPLVARIKARTLSALKKTDAALAAAQVALKEAEALGANSPDYQEQRPAALIVLADLSGTAGQPYYETIVKEHPASRFAFPARYQLAFLQAQAGKLPEALAQAQALVKQLDESPAPATPALQAERTELRRKALFAAADYAFRSNALGPAETYLKEYSELPAVKADPAKMQLDLATLRLAWCRHGANDFPGAITLLDKALNANPAAELKQEMLYLRGRARLDAAAKTPDNAEIQKALDDYASLVKDAPASAFAAHAKFEAGQLLIKTKPADALPWFDKLIDGPAPADTQLLTDGLLLRARARYALGKSADALTDVEALLKRTDKTKEQTSAAYVVKGLCLEASPAKEGDADKAYSDLIAAGPADSAEVRIALLRRGKLRFNTKRFEEAKKDLSAFAGSKELNPSDAAEVEAAILVAVCQKELKDVAGAQAQFEKIAKLPLTGAAAFEVPFQLGNLAYEAGKHADAAADYRKALDAAAQIKDLPVPALSAAWLNMAWCYRRTNEVKKAADAFDELIKLDPTGPFSAEARYHRGRLLAESNNPDGAIALWKEVLDKQPDTPFAEKSAAAIAGVQLKAGRIPEATKSFELYLAKFPTADGVRDALCGLAECRLRDKKPDAAKDTYMKLLGDKGLDAELDDVGERAVIGLAQIAFDAKKVEDAKKLALRIVIDRPDSKLLDQALMLCGSASEEMKEPSQAIGYYRKVVSDRPQSDRADTARERLKALGAPADK
jgi:tetratricopeptide (TPR) repeat protein